MALTNLNYGLTYNLTNNMKQKLQNLIAEKKEYVEQNDLIPALSVLVLVVGMPIGVLVGWLITSLN
jgi:hypothetical protein